MTKQQNLHRAGLSAVADLEKLVDRIKEAGPCPLDGRNALMNLRQQVEGLLNRFPADKAQPKGERWSPGEYIGFMQELAMDCGFKLIDNEADDGSMECAPDAFAEFVNRLLRHAEGIRSRVALVDSPVVMPEEERAGGGQ